MRCRSTPSACGGCLTDLGEPVAGGGISRTSGTLRHRPRDPHRQALRRRKGRLAVLVVHSPHRGRGEGGVWPSIRPGTSLSGCCILCQLVAPGVVFVAGVAHSPYPGCLVL